MTKKNIFFPVFILVCILRASFAKGPPIFHIDASTAQEVGVENSSSCAKAYGDQLKECFFLEEIAEQKKIFSTLNTAKKIDLLNRSNLAEYAHILSLYNQEEWEVFYQHAVNTDQKKFPRTLNEQAALIAECKKIRTIELYLALSIGLLGVVSPVIPAGIFLYYAHHVIAGKKEISEEQVKEFLFWSRKKEFFYEK